MIFKKTQNENSTEFTMYWALNTSIKPYEGFLISAVNKQPYHNTLQSLFFIDV